MRSKDFVIGNIISKDHILVVLAALFFAVPSFGQKYSNGKQPSGWLPSRLAPHSQLRKSTKPNQVLMSLGDSTLKYVDADTASTIFGGGIGSINKGVIFYVARPDTGLANASNPLFVEMLAKARMGDDRKPYPCITSARDSAEAYIATNGGRATVWILSSNYFSFGSAIAAENGGEVADEQHYPAFALRSSSVNIIREASLIHDGLDYYFEDNSGINIISNNSATPFACYADTVGFNGTVWPKYSSLTCGVYGNGNFTGKYGELTATDGTSNLVLCIHANANFTFHANNIRFKGWRIFWVVPKELFIDVKQVECQASNVVWVQNGLAGAGADSSKVNVHIGTLRIGEKYTPYAANPANDFWYPIIIGYLRNATINIDIDNALIAEEDNYLLRLEGSLIGCNINIHLGNLVHEIGHYNYWPTVASPPMSLGGNSWNTINYTIDNADAELPFGARVQFIGSNNIVNLTAKNWRTKNKRYAHNCPAVFINHGYYEAGYDTTTNNIVTISGNFTSENGNALRIDPKYSYEANSKIIFDNCIFRSLTFPALTQKGTTNYTDRYYFRNCQFSGVGANNFVASDALPHTLTSLGGNTSNLSASGDFTIQGIAIVVNALFGL